MYLVHCSICTQMSKSWSSYFCACFRNALAALHYNENSLRQTCGYSVRFPKYKNGLPAVRALKGKPTCSTVICTMKHFKCLKSRPVWYFVIKCLLSCLFYRICKNVDWGAATQVHHRPVFTFTCFIRWWSQSQSPGHPSIRNDSARYGASCGCLQSSFWETMKRYTCILECLLSSTNPTDLFVVFRVRKASEINNIRST